MEFLHPAQLAFYRHPTEQGKNIFIFSKPQLDLLWGSQQELIHLNCDAILLYLILCHIPSIAAPLGHHLCLAEGDLVHLLDVVVQVARRAACVLADWTDPRFFGAVEPS